MSFKQEAIAALDFYKRNMAHVLGEEDERVRVIERCIGMVDEIKEQGWTPVTKALPPFTSSKLNAISYSDEVLTINTDGDRIICTYDSFGNWYDHYGDYIDVVEWMPIPES